MTYDEEYQRQDLELTQKALELIMEWRNCRTTRAKLLLEYRREIRGNGVKRVRLVNRLARDLVKHIPYLQKPTFKVLRQEALELLEFSRTRWSNPYDTEYYSACGFDDMQSMEREGALKHAPIFARAARIQYTISNLNHTNRLIEKERNNV